ncbi:hypothetical protein COCNU_07G014140 [Cocos nucifera]|uniref:Uncharacterized protein n=1 Tax=Cocos nucifera TaxID=13894 RepID=A0A8K0IGN9_COCNU|nr:hypothetical protein COCNU_07G014140 [Cocos nucifera]
MRRSFHGRSGGDHVQDGGHPELRHGRLLLQGGTSLVAASSQAVAHGRGCTCEQRRATSGGGCPNAAGGACVAESQLEAMDQVMERRFGSGRIPIRQGDTQNRADEVAQGLHSSSRCEGLDPMVVARPDLAVAFGSSGRVGKGVDP